MKFRHHAGSRRRQEPASSKLIHEVSTSIHCAGVMQHLSDASIALLFAVICSRRRDWLHQPATSELDPGWGGLSQGRSCRNLVRQTSAFPKCELQQSYLSVRSYIHSYDSVYAANSIWLHSTKRRHHTIHHPWRFFFFVALRSCSDSHAAIRSANDIGRPATRGGGSSVPSQNCLYWDQVSIRPWT
jgi:hypothetical protein